jgi:hypothetical protein
VVIPVFNDWESLQVLIGALKESLPDAGVHLVIVDDGSTEPESGVREALAATGFDATLVKLTRNVGHQRAIAIGLCQATDLRAETVVIMDGDGEDRPQDVPRLIAALQDNPRAIVVANRNRRSEGPGFIFFYNIYKRIFLFLTGSAISFGNFSVMKLATARRLSCMHELLLHVPATMISSRCKIVPVATDRGERYRGRSKMNLVSLVVHGLSSVAVFSERTFTRILLLSAMVFALSGLAAAVAIVLKLIGLATPGWATTVSGIVMIILVQTAAVSLGGLFIVLNNKRDFTLIPHRIAPMFIDQVTRFAEGDEIPGACSADT